MSEMPCRRKSQEDLYKWVMEWAVSKDGFYSSAGMERFFASGLFPQENSEDFFVRDTRRAIQEAAKKHCFACSKMGATITCWKTGCDRSFHLPCAPQGECVTQFFGLYRSFCWEHRPRQAVQARPRQNNTCSICLDTVEDKTSYKTMVCPACQDARFHRHCIQRLALHAGICFRCPCCQNQEPFLMEMLTMGIRISKRLFFLFPTHKALGPSAVPA
ncbi:PHD finger protein 7-like protein [Pitangus sulphuratus]|nr:PHD finger protein 7-like protein [Pitangus sulphuratus]